MNKKLSVKTIVAIGIGAAVFFVLGRFVSIPMPMIANTNIQTNYPFLALMAALFGPIAGLCIGFIGHLIIDMTTYAPWWSWIICSGAVGLCYGLVGYKLKLSEGEFTKKDIIFFNIGQLIVNMIAWAVIAPILDIAIYAEPANKVFVQGIFSGITNSLSVGVIGTLLMIAYAATRTKKGSLSKED